MKARSNRGQFAPQWGMSLGVSLELAIAMDCDGGDVDLFFEAYDELGGGQ